MLLLAKMLEIDAKKDKNIQQAGFPDSHLL
jgi:hypothetical protein